jgi:hypothetical protein
MAWEKVLDFALKWTGGAIDEQTQLLVLPSSLVRRPFASRASHLRWRAYMLG